MSATRGVPHGDDEGVGEDLSVAGVEFVMWSEVWGAEGVGAKRNQTALEEWHSAALYLDPTRCRSLL